MEWRTGALTQADVSDDVRNNPLGDLPGVSGFYSQLSYAAEQMTAGYYGWRNGSLTSLLLPDSTTTRPDYFQTAGTVAVQYLFSSPCTTSPTRCGSPIRATRIARPHRARATPTCAAWARRAARR